MLRQPWSMLDDDGTAVALPSPKVPESQFFAIVDTCDRSGAPLFLVG